MATLVVAVASVATGLILLELLQVSMTRNVDALARVRASDVAALARSGTLRNSIPTPFEEGSLVQVLDAAGRVVASSDNLRGQSPIVAASFLRAGGGIRTLSGLPIGEQQAFRVVIERASSSRGPLTILVAVSLAPSDHTLHQVRLSLLAALPVLLCIVAATTWIMTGRTLEPVESIRARVDEISTEAMGRRVPVPATSDEVERLARTMNSMLDRVEAAQVRERRFVADASHELRSPIAAIRAQLESALAYPGSADWPEVANAVLNEDLSMGRLIGDLLLLARADDRAVPEAREPFDLGKLALKEAERLRAGEGDPVDVSRVEEVGIVGDPDQLARVIRNLLENAQRHADSTVSLEVAAAGEYAEMTVEDDGPGIPPAERQRVFERFSRLDEARSRRSGGVGLGLPIAREIVEAHGGTIAVVDSHKGARILVRIPRTSGSWTTHLGNPDPSGPVGPTTVPEHGSGLNAVHGHLRHPDRHG